MGVLGAGLTFAVLWYLSTPPGDVVQAAPASPLRVASATAPKAGSSHEQGLATAPKALSLLASADDQGPASHVSNEDGRGVGVLLNGQGRPGELEPQASEVFVEPLTTALPKTMERMAELQRISADPKALAARVQAMETDEAELAKLKAFAERFVTLPPDRVQRHVPGTARSNAVNSGQSPRGR